MPGRPAKQWMRRCVAGVSSKGVAYDPGAVCGAVWQRKTPREKAALVRAENPIFKRDSEAESAFVLASGALIIGAGLFGIGYGIAHLFKRSTAPAVSTVKPDQPTQPQQPPQPQQPTQPKQSASFEWTDTNWVDARVFSSGDRYIFIATSSAPSSTRDFIASQLTTLGWRGVTVTEASGRALALSVRAPKLARIFSGAIQVAVERGIDLSTLYIAEGFWTGPVTPVPDGVGFAAESTPPGA